MAWCVSDGAAMWTGNPDNVVCRIVRWWDGESVLCAAAMPTSGRAGAEQEALGAAVWFSHFRSSENHDALSPHRVAGNPSAAQAS